MNNQFANNNFDKLFDVVGGTNKTEPTKTTNNSARPSSKTKMQSKVDEILKIGDKLNERHEAYVTEFIVRGNKALYALLADIYQYALSVDSSPYKENIVFTMRKELKENYSIKTTENTSLMMLVVKYVVRNIDRQTAYNYASALGTAYTKDIAVEELANYITECGGVSKLAKGTTTEEENNKKLALKSKTESVMKAYYARAFAKNNIIEVKKDEILSTCEVVIDNKEKKGNSAKYGDFEFAVLAKAPGTNNYAIAGVFNFDAGFEQKVFQYIGEHVGGSAEDFEGYYQRTMEKLEAAKQTTKSSTLLLPAP